MNISGGEIGDIKKIADSSKSIIIIIRPNPEADHVASALSLYLSLTSSGKETAVICPTSMTVDFSHLVGVDKVQNKLNGQTGRNLVVSFPYEEGSIEKVSYNIENGKFNLVIEPREGYEKISSNDVNFSYSGGSSETVITVGVKELENLGEIYTQNSAIFENNLINIDDRENSRFGKINLIAADSSSICEMLTNALPLMGYSLNADIATNLLSGITSATNNFASDKATASTFEAAAICLKNGAVKPKQETRINYDFPLEKKDNSVKQPIDNKTITFGKQENKPPSQTPKIKFQPPQKQQGNQQSQQQNKQQPQNQAKNQHQASEQQKKQQDAPADWLKPKIYKGSTLL